MNQLRSFLARMGYQFRMRLSSFMAGRYGSDRLNMAILGVGLVASLVSAFLTVPAVRLLLCLISYILMGLAIFRALSRNRLRRYQENRRFLLLLDRVKDRQNRYFICPKCRQTVRVPRGKGKISITCPKCREKFQRRT